MYALVLSQVTLYITDGFSRIHIIINDLINQNYNYVICLLLGF